MKVKKLLSVFTVVTMLISMLPGLPVSAYVDSQIRFKRVTSADDLVVGAKYLIVGYDADEAVYYAPNDKTDNQNLGLRAPAELKDNGDGTLSALEYYSNAYPLVTELSKQYVTGENKYSFLTETGAYLNAFYYYRKAYPFSDYRSKSLPLDGFSGASEWEMFFRDDGTVLFKTTKKIDSVNQSSYIRFFHYKENDISYSAFSGGELNDEQIDLPDGITADSLTKEEDLPCKTYLYKEICEHNEEYLTHFAANKSTCKSYGNIEYYICSNCCGYLLSDKKTEIKLSDTELPLAEHANTTFVSATAPTCQAHGNIDYTYCADCGEYFEGNSTENIIEEKAAIIPSVNHSYVDGVCRFCHGNVENAYFARSESPTGDGHRYIFVAEYNNKFYAMGDKFEKGMSAVEVEDIATGKYLASSESAVFAEVITSDEMKRSTVTGNNYWPDYIKIGQNYLTNNSLTLTLDYNKDTATYWRSKSGFNANGDYVNYYCDDPNDEAFICLVTGDGEPYFSMCTAEDSTHIKAGICGEVCSHANKLVHTERLEPTCKKDGNIEYWYCSVCSRYFSDSKGLKAIEVYDIPLLSVGAKDEDENDICDLCGKSMPVYTRVTSADEIIMGNKYILVSEIGGSLYTLKFPERGKTGYDDLGKAIAASSITANDDGSIEFSSAKRAEALMTNLGFACDCTDLDNGSIRYALRTNVDNKVLNLESYGGFTITGYAKYGWRIALNEDGSVKMADVYDENWNKGNGLLRVYKLKEGEATSVFFSASESSEHTSTGNITQYPVYLYRLTESGKVGITPYRINDCKSTVNIDSVEIPNVSTAAANISYVSGVYQSLSKTAIENYIKNTVGTESLEEVQMNVVVGITAMDYKERDLKAQTGGSITFEIAPKLKITTASDINVTEYNIPNEALDGSPITVNLYTGGIEPRQIIHIKHDGSKEYFYEEGTEEALKNGGKSFALSYDRNGNIYVSFTLTEFSKIKLLETPEDQYSISNYDEKEGSVTVLCAKAGKYALIFADYEKDEFNAKIEIQDLKAGENTVPVSKDITLSLGDKIFLWKDIQNIQPLCEEYTIKK